MGGCSSAAGDATLLSPTATAPLEVCVPPLIASDMAEAIRGKAVNGHSARLVAGFCWPWSNPDSSGHLVDDLRLDGFSMPWNAMPDAGKLAFVSAR
jgi:hypothetical protein